MKVWLKDGATVYYQNYSDVMYIEIVDYLDGREVVDVEYSDSEQNKLLSIGMYR